MILKKYYILYVQNYILIVYNYSSQKTLFLLRPSTTIRFWSLRTGDKAAGSFEKLSTKLNGVISKKMPSWEP